MDTHQQQPLVAALEAADPEIAERLVTRRAALARGATASAAVAAGLRLASVPVALAALSRDVFGQSTALPAAVIGVLNYALILEELEYEFYRTGTNPATAPNLIPPSDAAIFATIRGHELAHVEYLRATLGKAARPKPTFDFSAGNGSGNGPFKGLFGNYALFTAVAQAFEDTGVRAYKGQAPALKPYPAVLTAALTIHSVEARHAAEVRRLRGDFVDDGVYKGWITLNNTDIMQATATYAGEQNTNQGGVELTTALPAYTAAQISEAFDEPLTQAQVLAIVDPFIV